MKSRLIKSVIIIGISTLFVFNIQLIFNTSDSSLFSGSTAKAAVYVKEHNTEDLPHYYLHRRQCLNIDIDIDFYMIATIPVLDAEFNVTPNSKTKCKSVNQDIWCAVEKEKGCGE